MSKKGWDCPFLTTPIKIYYFPKTLLEIFDRLKVGGYRDDSKMERMTKI